MQHTCTWLYIIATCTCRHLYVIYVWNYDIVIWLSMCVCTCWLNLMSGKCVIFCPCRYEYCWGSSGLQLQHQSLPGYRCTCESAKHTQINVHVHVQYTSVHASMILCSMCMYHLPKPRFSGPFQAFQYYTETLGMGLGMRLTHSRHLFSRLGIYMYIYLHVCMYVSFPFAWDDPPPFLLMVDSWFWRQTTCIQNTFSDWFLGWESEIFIENWIIMSLVGVSQSSYMHVHVCV